MSKQLLELSVKRCSGCAVIQHFDQFYVSKAGAGGVGSRCKTCLSSYARERYRSNPVPTRERSREWYAANSSRALESCRARRAKKPKREPRPVSDPREKARARYHRNRDANLERARAWREANIELARERARISAQKRRATPAGAMAKRVSKAVRRCLGRRGADKNGPTFSALPYTPAELVRHIERQFSRGMGWHNMNSWHIDHIVPLSSFEIVELGDASFQRAWALSNLRPLWASENLSKGSGRGMLV